jgi:PST family polysaccharide transporter
MVASGYGFPAIRRARLRRLAFLVGGVLFVEVSGRLAAQLASFAVARSLGPRQFGVLTLGLTVLGLSAVAADFGSTDSSVQRFTTREDGIAQFRLRSKGVRLLVGGAISAGAIAATALVSVGIGGAITVPILLIAVLPQLIILNAVIERRVQERFRVAAIANTTVVLASGAGALVGVLLQRSAVAAAVGTVVGMAIAACFWSLRGAFQASIPRMLDIRQSGSAGVPFFVAAMSVNLYTRGDRLFVAGYADERTLGLYAAAYTLVFAFSMLGATLQIVLLPYALRTYLRTGGLGRWRRDAMVMFAVGFLLAALLYSFRATIVRIVYGATYGGASFFLGILVWLLPFYLLNPFLGNSLIASGQQRLLARVCVVNLVVALTAYWAGTSIFGAVGTSVASVCVEFAGSCQMVILLRRGPHRSQQGPRVSFEQP